MLVLQYLGSSHCLNIDLASKQRHAGNLFQHNGVMDGFIRILAISAAATFVMISGRPTYPSAVS